jgi:hypothetical protein
MFMLRNISYWVFDIFTLTYYIDAINILDKWFILLIKEVLRCMMSILQ